MSEPRRSCAMGDGRPVAPPAKVPLGWPDYLCEECLDALARAIASEAKAAAEGS